MIPLDSRYVIATIPLLLACANAPDSAKPEFSDAVVFIIENFEGAETDLVYALQDLEAQIYTSMDVEAKNPNDRALTPNALQPENIVDMPNPGKPGKGGDC